MKNHINLELVKNFQMLLSKRLVLSQDGRTARVLVNDLYDAFEIDKSEPEFAIQKLANALINIRESNLDLGIKYLGYFEPFALNLDGDLCVSDLENLASDENRIEDLVFDVDASKLENDLQIHNQNISKNNGHSKRSNKHISLGLDTTFPMIWNLNDTKIIWRFRKLKSSNKKLLLLNALVDLGTLPLHYLLKETGYLSETILQDSVSALNQEASERFKTSKSIITNEGNGYKINDTFFKLRKMKFPNKA